MTNSRKRLQGRVVSDKMDKTVVVEIERVKMHRVYKKVIRTSKRVMAHDESNQITVGTIVRIVESKPLSRHKRWVVEEVVPAPSSKATAPVAESSQDTTVEGGN
ncbi:MAG UNVERIFIED_CONTAM: 30S ribosomal protein S17 [Anaerolineae bacterium]